MFEYHRRVHFYETDLMGIVHHANYLRLAEEARVDWANKKGLLPWDNSQAASAFAVLGTQVHHVLPAKFGDLLKIEVQARINGARVVFEYKMWKDDQLMAEVRTKHANLGPDLRPQRPSRELRALMEKEAWNETWLSNL